MVSRSLARSPCVWPFDRGLLCFVGFFGVFLALGDDGEWRIKHKPAHAVPVASARPDQNPRAVASQSGPEGPWPTSARWRVLEINPGSESPTEGRGADPDEPGCEFSETERGGDLGRPGGGGGCRSLVEPILSVFSFQYPGTPPPKVVSQKLSERLLCDRESEVLWGVRWFEGTLLRCEPADEPAIVPYALRAAWFVIYTIRAFAATHARPGPQCAPRCSARARCRRDTRLSSWTPSAAPIGSRTSRSIASRRTRSAPLVY